MFSEIKQYKTLGFNKSQVERALNINYKTVQNFGTWLADGTFEPFLYPSRANIYVKSFDKSV